jgi:hypothetical protein
MSHVHATAAKSTKDAVEGDSIADSDPAFNESPFLFVRMISLARNNEDYHSLAVLG